MHKSLYIIAVVSAIWIISGLISWALYDGSNSQNHKCDSSVSCELTE